MGIKEKTKFIILKGEGQILLQKLDVEGIAEKLEKELAEKNIDAITKTVRKEINEKIRTRYPDVLT